MMPMDQPATALQVAEISTAWQAGDTLTVDAYGQLVVRKWTQGA